MSTAAAQAIVVLSSSPAPPKYPYPGSRAAPIPAGAVTGFRSARELAVEADAIEKETDAAEKDGSNGKADRDSDARSRKRKRRSDGSKLKLDKKPRAKKETSEKRSTKAGNTTKRDEPSPKEQVFRLPPGMKISDAASRHFQKQTTTTTENLKSLATTTSTTSMMKPTETALNVEQTVAPGSETAVGPMMKPLAYQPEPLQDEAPVETLVSREKISPNKQQSVIVVKAQKIPARKSSKKRLATITANAIANTKLLEHPNRLSEQDENLISQDCPEFGIENIRRPHLVNLDTNKPVSKKSAQDASNPKKKKKKPNFVEYKVRSPESARRRMQHQDFVFGTSSQLVREDPTFIRDLQAAIKASESQAAIETSESQAAAKASRSSTDLSRGAGKTLLWSAGAEGSTQECIALQERIELPLQALQALQEPESNTNASITSSKLKLSSATAQARPRMLVQVAQAPTLSAPLINSHTAMSQILSAHVATQANQMSTKAPPTKRARGRPRKDENARQTTPKKATKRRKKAVADPEDFTPIDDIEDNDPPSPSPPRRHSPAVLAQLELKSNTLSHDKEGEGNDKNEAEAEAEAEAAAAAATAAAAQKALIKAKAQNRVFAQIAQAVKASSSPTAQQGHPDTYNPTWWERILMYDPIVLEDLTAWLNEGALEDAAAAALPEMALPGADDHDGTVECAGLVNGKVTPSLVRRWCDRNSVCCVWRDGAEWR